MQPEDVLGPADRSAGHQPPAQFQQHPPQLWPGQAHVGQRVLARRRHHLGATEQALEPRPTDRIQPRGDRGRGLLPPLRRAPPPISGVGALAAQIEAQRVQQRRRRIGRHRVGEVEVVDGMPEPLEMIMESAPPLGPVRVVPPGRRVQHLSGRPVEDGLGELGMVPGPGGQVVQRLLGADRLTVEAQQESAGRRISGTTDEPVVEGREDDLGHGGDRDDRLDRGVVLGARVQQCGDPVEQFMIIELLDRPSRPLGHGGSIARMGVVAPTGQPAALSVGGEHPEGGCACAA